MKHSLGFVPTAATLTKLFEVPAGHKIDMHTFRVNLGAATAKTFTFYWQFGSDASKKIYLSRNQSAATQDVPPFTGNLILQAGDSMWFDSEAGSTPTVICSFNMYEQRKINAFDT